MQTVEPIRKISDIEKVKSLLKLKKERDYLLFVMGINCGLRISDLLKLKVSDVKNKTYIEIVEQKTGKKRRLLLRENLIKLINNYIKDKSEEQWLFKSQKGSKAVTRVQAYRIINSVCKKAGFRKTFGYHLYQMTKDVALLQNIFNHSSPSITMRYIGVNQDMIDLELQRFFL